MSTSTSTSTIDLTRAFAATPYRVAPGTTARYTPMGGATDCDECAGRQHENRVATKRARAKVRRQVGDDIDRALLLCGPDAQLWRERDVADMAPTR